ncbi:MAG: hypothetical protein KGH54_04555 [Candidatus Micrarchaeota archaeon]|nr:hypothetical protein [Candidatus Micrarchaeota archaeon]
MPRLNRILGYKREPIQGNDDVGLWTMGQRVRKEPDKVKEHAEAAFRDIKSKLDGVGNALRIINDERASSFSKLMDSPELRARVSAEEERALGTVKEITRQILEVLENPNARRPYGSGPTGGLEMLRQATTPTYDFVCPVRLPDEIAHLVDVSHEAEQYRSKEKRLMSDKFSEFAKHELGSMVGANTATKQILALKSAAGKLNEQELMEYLVKYNNNAIIATIFLEARKKGAMDSMREFLNGVDMETIRKYSPYRNYESAAGTEKGTGSAPAGSETSSTTSPSASAGAKVGSTAENMKVVAEIEKHKVKLMELVDKIKDGQDTELINEANHQSLEFTMFSKSVMNLLEDGDRQKIRLMLEEVKLKFISKGESAKLPVYYIPEVKYYDLTTQNGEQFIKDWNEYLIDLHQNHNPIFLSKDGDMLAIKELEELLKRINTKTAEKYSAFGALLRDSNIESPVFGGSDKNLGSATFGTK